MDIQLVVKLSVTITCSTLFMNTRVKTDHLGGLRCFLIRETKGILSSFLGGYSISTLVMMRICCHDRVLRTCQLYMFKRERDLILVIIAIIFITQKSIS